MRCCHMHVGITTMEFIILVTIANAIQRQDESFINGVATKESSIRTNSWVKMVFICIANIIYKRKEQEEHEYENTGNNT